MKNTKTGVSPRLQKSLKLPSITLTLSLAWKPEDSSINSSLAFLLPSYTILVKAQALARQPLVSLAHIDGINYSF